MPCIHVSCPKHALFLKQKTMLLASLIPTACRFNCCSYIENIVLHIDIATMAHAVLFSKKELDKTVAFGNRFGNEGVGSSYLVDPALICRTIAVMLT